VNLVRITTTRSFSVFQTVRVAIEQVNLYSYAGYRQRHLLRSNCSYLPGVARGYDVSCCLGGREEAFDEWVSSTPFFLSRFPVMRRGKPRMLSEHYQKMVQSIRFFNTCNTFPAKAGNPTGNMRMV